jgi:hypothetical protein
LSNLCILVNEGEDLLETYQRRGGLAVDSTEVSAASWEEKGEGGSRERRRDEGGGEREKGPRHADHPTSDTSQTVMRLVLCGCSSSG